MSAKVEKRVRREIRRHIRLVHSQEQEYRLARKHRRRAAFMVALGLLGLPLAILAVALIATIAEGL